MNKKFEAVPIEEWLKQPRARKAYNCLRKSGDVISSYYYPNDEKEWQFEYTNITHVLVAVEDEWVSVSDRLPEPGIKIQFETNHIMSPDNLYYGCYQERDGGKFYHAYHGYVKEDVTFWRYADIPPQPPSQTNKPE